MKKTIITSILITFVLIFLTGFSHAGQVSLSNRYLGPVNDAETPRPIEQRTPSIKYVAPQLPNNSSNLINIKANKDIIQIEADFTIIEIKGSNNNISINLSDPVTLSDNTSSNITSVEFDRIKFAMEAVLKVVDKSYFRISCLADGCIYELVCITGENCRTEFSESVVFMRKVYDEIKDLKGYRME